MPAAITSANTRKSAKTADKPNVHSSMKKTRTVRRRGRAKKGLESDDDEIEREARTDSETDDNSSVLSESESDTASDDDDHPANSFEVVTPSTTQSPPPLHVKDASTSDEVISVKAPLLNGESGPFVGTTDWAQMVADETAAGGGDLPVIDFSDLNGHTIAQRAPPNPPRTQKQKKQAKKAASAAAKVATAPTPPARVDDQEQPEPVADHEPVASSSRPSSRERRPSSRTKGPTPRQAYQQRLEKDPSYVPTVGEFWGHDDRLLDKDLRSLSGWWRGRWQTRGRGRGGFSMRGRGRGGFVGGRVPGYAEEAEEEEGEFTAESDVPPVDRAWTHDGFEEMKRREERRRAQLDQQKQQQATRATSPPQRGVPFRGRGGFIGARGRGGFVRGGSPHSHSSPTGGSRFNPTPERSGRVWFAMPPEKSWTKHHDYTLYSDYQLKPRFGHGPGYRVKLPGRISQVVRGPPKHHASAPSIGEQSTTGRPASTVAPSEDGDRAFVVRIPNAAQKQADPVATVVLPKAAPPVSPAVDSTAELSIEEVFTVRPSGAPVHIPIAAPEAPSTSSVVQRSPLASTTQQSSLPQSPATRVSHLPDTHAQQQLEQILINSPVDASVNVQIEDTVLRKSGPPGIHAPVPQGLDEFRPQPSALHPIQTSFSPAPQPSPPYGSPYAYGSLPPGVAIGPHGYPYEVATGRPVYLQATPPPAMYTPRPMMHAGHHHSSSVPFIPGHMHHSSVASSPDFLSPHSHPHTPPVSGFVDPMTGVPIFTPARQSSRIEIRAPGDPQVKQKMPLGPSGLRATVSGSETSSQSNGDTSTFFAESVESNTTHETATGSQEMIPGVDDYLQSQGAQGPAEGVNMAYPPQYQQYYYPEHYGYQPYVDPNVPQVMQYDMYRPDSLPPHQPMVYY
ncbi:hypothetical protein EIP91_008315 [Steccherinum ochraceum]|uniref:Btz domain-containing protein n=1 Tax=Steccherinum ochraceum TaxID=92696 RepID=A0A4R0RPW1_9APHY|nr:hypothetical protein EIP91_008315 [Steccherinum ochraceum]